MTPTQQFIDHLLTHVEKILPMTLAVFSAWHVDSDKYGISSVLKFFRKVDQSKNGVNV